MYRLVGDIGGTQSRFRLIEGETARWHIVQEAAWPSSRFDSLTEAVACCLDTVPPSARATIGGAWLAVAGPIEGGAVKLSNLPWTADANQLRDDLGLPTVRLVNDLEALVHALPTLGADQLRWLQEGVPRGSRKLVISVGTGLGVGACQGEGDAFQTYGSEGGHSDLAPVTPMHHALLNDLGKQYDHVSYERALSGRGLVALYEFACRRADTPPFDGDEPRGNPAARVTELAQAGDAAAMTAMALFAELYGAFAGNAALQWLPSGGIYLAGGVTAHAHLGDAFLQTFAAKGRMRSLLEKLPVAVITEPEPGLEGVSLLALRAADGAS